MKKIAFLSLALLVCSIGFAKKVKFAVDMTGQTINTNGIHVAGDFQTLAGFSGGDWASNTTVLTQEGSSNIYSIVVTIPAFAKYEYKFLNGDQFYDAEFVPLESRANYNFSDNRWLYVDSLANDTTFVGAILFAGNAPDGLQLMRFKVDMQTTGSVAASGVHVAGSFQGWSTVKTRMYSFDGNLYEHIAYVTAGTYEYKFINGNASPAYESVPSGCASNINRSALIQDHTELDTVCFASCSACMLVSGIVEQGGSSETISLYPNPSSAGASLSFATAALRTVTVSDLQGRIIETYAGTGQSLNLPDSGRAKGIYLLRVTNAGGQGTMLKFIQN